MTLLRQDLEYAPCALCGQYSSEIIFSENPFSVVRCRRCGLIYVNPRPTREEIARKLQQETGVFEIDFFRYLRLEPLSRLKSIMLLRMINEHEPEIGTILDVGCASGSLLEVARDLGYKTFGVEISPTFANYARKSGLNVYLGTVKQAGFPYEFFDVVTMINVLSYLDNPIEDLREIHRILKKDGWMVIENGNRGELDSKQFVERWGDSWFCPHHLIHYSERTLRRLLSVTGFECVALRRFCLVPNLLMKKAIRSLTVRSSFAGDNTPSIKGVSSPKASQLLLTLYAYLELFTTYQLGRLNEASNILSTMIVFARKK